MFGELLLQMQGWLWSAEKSPLKLWGLGSREDKERSEAFCGVYIRGRIYSKIRDVGKMDNPRFLENRERSFEPSHSDLKKFGYFISQCRIIPYKY